MVSVPEERPYGSGDIRLPSSSQQEGSDAMDIDEKEPEPTTSKVVYVLLIFMPFYARSFSSPQP